jgi:hypothetical protein
MKFVRFFSEVRLKIFFTSRLFESRITSFLVGELLFDGELLETEAMKIPFGDVAELTSTEFFIAALCLNLEFL